MNADYALLTDYYELTMANGYILKGIADKPAVFELFFRSAPFKGTYAICYGLNKAFKDIQDMKFSKTDIDYLQERTIFSNQFLDYLTHWKCTLTVRAVEDGRIIFPHEPIAEVEGPLIQCQLIETFLLNSFNFPTLVATKANRMWLASGKQPILEFGLRRAQGPNGGLAASEASMVGGCTATSNVLAGKKYGITASGTMAHSWVMAFKTELDAFRAYADLYPDSCILLVDTYDTLKSGVPNAIIVGKELESQGKKLLGVRLDSGDIADLSIKTREMLDEAGLEEAKIVASNEIDEYIIEEIKSKNGAVDIWGIGTKLATCYDQPALGGVYKLIEIDNEPKLKIAGEVEKTTVPAKKQVYRVYNKEDLMIGDVIELIDKPFSDEEYIYDFSTPSNPYKLDDSSKVEPLLNLKMKNGKLIGKIQDWRGARKRMEDDLSHFSEASKAILNPEQYKVGISQSLYDLRIKLIETYSIKS